MRIWPAGCVGPGCVGINFTGDSASAAMLAAYRQPHGQDDLARAVRLCREEGIAVMIDLLLGGPGETPETVAETIEFVRRIGPDCAGSGLGRAALSRHGDGRDAGRRRAAGTPIPPSTAAMQGPIDLLQAELLRLAGAGRRSRPGWSAT